VIAGFGGGLISHSYLEAQIASLPDEGRSADVERQIVRW
jgi:hypothetical protein